MKSKIQISIPQPCHENWDEMTISEKGRFCASCQKNVIDFTKLSDREIVKAFDTNKNLCGRFNETQLNRELFVPKEKNTVWIAAASGVLAFLGIGTHTAKAQERPKTESIAIIPLDINSKESKAESANFPDTIKIEPMKPMAAEIQSISGCVGGAIMSIDISTPGERPESANPLNAFRNLFD